MQNESDKLNLEFLMMLNDTYLYNVLNVIETVWILLRDFKEFNKNDFIKCINEYIIELKSEEEPNSHTWDYFFNDEELMKNMLVYYLNIDAYLWTGLFDVYTDYSTSEINEFIREHIGYFNLDINGWKFYSSALNDL